MAGYLFNPAQITFGSTTGTVAQGNDPRIVGAAQSASSVQAVSAATTLTTASLPKIVLCSGSSYALTLAAASACANQTQRIMIDAGLTGLVTLTGAGSDLIDGQTTRIMWAGESAQLYSDGSKWSKIAGKSLPMIVKLQRQGADQTAAVNNYTQCQLNTLVDGPSAMFDAANNRGKILRPGKYLTLGFGYVSSGGNLGVGVSLNAVGNTSASNNGYQVAGTGSGSVFSNTFTCAANDWLVVWFYAFGSSSNVLGTSPGSYAQLVITELPTW